VEIIKHNNLSRAAHIIKSGGVLVYPTDTVWGIGCDANNKGAIERIKKIKNRKDTNFIILNTRGRYAKRTTFIENGVATRVIRTGWLNKLLKRCGVPLISTSANLHGEPPINGWRQAAVLNPDSVIKGKKIYKNKPSKIIEVTNGQIKVVRE
jgi:L-threonylcarbamoyladenylate synthase